MPSACPIWVHGPTRFTQTGMSSTAVGLKSRHGCAGVSRHRSEDVGSVLIGGRRLENQGSSSSAPDRHADEAEPGPAGLTGARERYGGRQNQAEASRAHGLVERGRDAGTMPQAPSGRRYGGLSWGMLPRRRCRFNGFRPTQEAAHGLVERSQGCRITSRMEAAIQFITASANGLVESAPNGQKRSKTGPLHLVDC